MPFDAENPNDFIRLRESIKHNFGRMESFRNVRKACADAAKGHYYDGDDDEFDSPDSVNTMDQWLNILVRSFVQDVPRVRVSSKEEPRTARAFEAHLNQVGIELDLGKTFKKIIREALLGYMGIAYVGIEDHPTIPGGASFVDALGLPEYCVDMARDDFSLIDFEAHTYQKRFDEMFGSGFYEDEVLEEGRTAYNVLIENKTKKHLDEMNSLYEWVDVWSVHVKPENLIVTMLDLDGFDKPIRVEKFDGPVWAPYIRLGFEDVLDGLIPNCRGAMILDLHEFVNSQYRKIFIKEDQSAEIFTYHGGAEDDARAIRDAADGEMVQVNDNNAVQRRRKGGTNPQSLATAIHARQLFDESSGNVRTAGGLGPVADTARQEALVSQNVGVLIGDMRNTFRAFAQKVYQAIAWYEWTNEERTRQVDVKAGKNGRAYADMWTPKMRQGDFARFTIEIIPESFEFRSSEEQANRIIRAMNNVVIPAMQLPSSRPVTLDTPGFVQKFAELDGIDNELSEFVNYSEDAVAGTSVSQGSSNSGAPPAQTQNQQGPQVEQQILERVLAGAVNGAAPEQDDGDIL